MTENLKNKSESDKLRHKAEQMLIKKKTRQTSQFSDSDLLRLTHELQVQQIELELQNEELRKAKELAETATNKLTALYDIAPLGYFTLTNRGRIIELNMAGAKMLGKERFYLQNKQLGIFITEDDRPAFNQFLNSVFESKTKQSTEIAFLSSENISTYVYLTGLVTENNEYCLLSGVDTTERKLAEKKLRESEETYRMLFENSGTSILIIDGDGKYLMINERAASEMGHSPREIIGKSIFDYLPEPEAKKYLEFNNSLLASGGHREYEDVFMVNGKQKTFFIIDQCLKDEYGNNFAIQSSSINITDRKKTEESLRLSETKWHNLFEILPVGVSIVDSKNGIEEFNTTLCQILDITKEGLMKGDYANRIYLRPDYTVMSPEEFPSMYALKENQIKRDVEIGVTKEDGSIIWTNVSAVPFSSTGSCITVTADITKRKLVEDTLKRSETLLKLFIEHSPATIAMFDLDMKYIITSRRYLIDYDLLEQNIIGRYHYEILPDIPQRWKDIYMHCLSGITEHCEDDLFLRSNGKVDWIRWEICPWYEADGKIGGIILFSEIITERKIAEQSLKKSEEIWHKLVATSPEFIAILDIEGNYLYLNHYATGFSEEDISGKKAVDFISGKSKAEFLAKFEKCKNTMETQHFEYDALTNNGTTGNYEGYLVPIIEESKVTSVMSIANDITHRKIADEEILKSREQLAQLIKHVNEVREEERTNIAREIHDDLGQSLACLKIDLLGIKEDIQENVGQTKKIDKAIALVDTTLKTVQKLSSQLRPQMLDELGLASAIEWQTNEFKKRTGIKCKLELEEIDDIADNIAISLFRIFQASLTNILLHSKAKSVSVKLEMKEDFIYLSVADDGIGITHEQLNSSKSFGIIGMRERANQINGKFEMNTQPGKGTKITVSVYVK